MRELNSQGEVVPLWGLADKVRGIVGAAGSFVLRNLRVRAERACAIDGIVGAMRGDYHPEMWSRPER